jgi:phage terminase large subunit-like protein
MATRRRKQPDDRPVRAADVLAFIEQTCRVPEGRLLGQPLKLAEFQVDFIKAVYDNPHCTRRAFLSTGKKNAKSTLTAALMLAHLCGPPARPNSQLYSTALNRAQAAIVFDAAAKMIRLNPELERAVRIMESAKTLVCSELGTRYRSLSADAPSAHGLSPQFVIHDELGQIRGPRSALYQALENATGALVDPLSIVISTQAANDTDLLSALLDDALGGHDPQTVVRLYAAPSDADPFSEGTIRLANPAFDVFMNRQEVLGMAATARRMPASEAEFRNLVLNQRVEIASPFIARAVWDACAAEPRDLRNCTVFGGLDLSESNDLTCLVLVGSDPLDGTWSVLPIFWLPEEGIRERAQKDRVAYDVWADQGWLELAPGRSISYEYVAERLRDLIEEYRISKIAFDAWGFGHFRPWLVKAGFSEQMIKGKFIEMRQGFKTMSPALRDFESLILERKIRHGGHPLLNMCAANAIVTTDPAGNRKLDKERASGRIDGMVALAMALAAAPAAWTQTVDVASLIG